MKRAVWLIVLTLAIIVFVLITGMIGTAMAADRNYITGEDPSEGAEVLEGWPEAFDQDPEPVVPGEPLTWSYLATIAGASALTLLIVQFLKVPLDSVFHIPTRILVYLIALVIMLVATALTTGLTVDNALLVCVNAVIAAVTAYGEYEVIFAKRDAAKVRATKVIT